MIGRVRARRLGRVRAKRPGARRHVDMYGTALLHTCHTAN